MSIPKVIHYCWFGGNPLPEKALACIESWRKYCPDYKIKEWNESNFDFSGNCYAREAAEKKKWAFVSDYARLAVLYEHGGIYMDTDVEVIKSLDGFLGEAAFSGFENGQYGITGIMAAGKNHLWIAAMLDSYRQRAFVLDDGTIDMTPNTVPATEIMVKEFGLVCDNSMQTLGCGVKIFPTDWFCPKDWRDGMMKITANTHTIHHYTGSWGDPAGARFQKRVRRWLPIFGERLAFKLAYIVTGFEKYGFIKGSKIALGRLILRKK